MQQTNLQIAPNGVKPIIHVSQFDIGRQFKIRLFDESTAYNPPAGSSVRIDGVKPDNHGFSYDDADVISVTDNVVTITTTTQMTIVEGTVQCELRITKDNDDIGTLNFDMIVERSPINEDTDLSETEVPALVTLARAQMENAEAWANGTRGGDPVAPSDPAYHNNAKYWSDQASVVAVDMVGATSESDGAHGLVPAPQAGDQDKVLKGDGTWGTISTTLSGLTDTDISNPTAGQVLSYDNSKWGNTSLGTAAAKNATDTLSSGSTDLIEAGAVYSANQTLTNQVSQLNFDGAGAHNSIYRGEYLGAEVTAEQYTHISDGTFKDMYIGDYWTIGEVNYRIGHFDYWYNTGDTACTTHHVLLVPDTNLASGKMNDTNTTVGGYAGSDFKTGNNSNTALATAKSTINNAFGSAHILTHREFFTNAVTDGMSSGWDVYDSDIDLMNEVMVYGCHVYSGAPRYETGIDKTQIKLFAERPDLITIRVAWWLRDVAGSTRTARVHGYGYAGADITSASRGVRPAFAIKA